MDKEKVRTGSPYGVFTQDLSRLNGDFYIDIYIYMGAE